MKTPKTARRLPPAITPEDLTDRQREIIACLLHGWLNKRIADKLGISTRAIDEAFAAISRRLRWHRQNRVLLALWAQKHGMEPWQPREPQ